MCTTYLVFNPYSESIARFLLIPKGCVFPRIIRACLSLFARYDKGREIDGRYCWETRALNTICFCQTCNLSHLLVPAPISHRATLSSSSIRVSPAGDKWLPVTPGTLFPSLGIETSDTRHLA